jgi:hypothetical protein
MSGSEKRLPSRQLVLHQPLHRQTQAGQAGTGRAVEGSMHQHAAPGRVPSELGSITQQ